jgi:uncharacterized protein (TIRG00374 family)
MSGRGAGRILKILQTRNARIVISAGLILLLLAKLDITRTAATLVEVRWDFLVAALATFAASLILGNVLSFYFVGAFFNNFLPANIGGDIVRVYDVYRESGRADETVAATVTDRLFGMVALGLLAVPAGAYVAFRYQALGLERRFGMWSLVIVLAFVAILSLTSAVIFSRRLARAIGRLGRPLMIRGSRDRFKRMYESFYLYRGTVRNLPAILAVAIIVQAFRVIVHYEVSSAMGLAIPAIYFFLFVPVIAIFIALPISIGGLGVREGLGIFFFCRAVPALTSEQAFTMGLLAYVVGVVVSLAGGVLYLSRGVTPGQMERELEEGRLTDAG